MRTIKVLFAVLSLSLLAACATQPDMQMVEHGRQLDAYASNSTGQGYSGPRNEAEARERLRGNRPSQGDDPPDLQIPDVTTGFVIDLYTGLDDKFELDPHLTPLEWRELGQVNAHCDLVMYRIQRNVWHYIKSAGRGGVAGGLGAMLGALIGFGSHINPGAYFAYGAMSGLFYGAANAEEQYDYAMRIAKGYCMTLQVEKADELDNKLQRVIVIPLVAGEGVTPPPDDNARDPYMDATGKTFHPVHPLTP